MPNIVKSLLKISLFDSFLIGFFVAGLSVWLTCFDWSDETKKESHERLIGIYKAIDLGENDAAVAKKIITKTYREKVYVEDNGRNSVWYVSAPDEFFQSHWVLTLCFLDEHLEGARFGVADNVNVPPNDAPSPKGICK